MTVLPRPPTCWHDRHVPLQQVSSLHHLFRDLTVGQSWPHYKLLGLFCITVNPQLWEQASKNGYPASQKATMEGLTTASGAHLETPLGMDMPAGTHGYWWDTFLCSAGYKGLGSH